jgi:hypothetical protein
MNAPFLDPDTQIARAPSAPPLANAPLHVAGGRATAPSPGRPTAPSAPDGHEHPLATAHF